MARQKITVRMARNILGDCFLLTYQAAQPDGSYGRATSILIDFGVLQAVEGAREIMQELGSSIRDLCHGHLDYLVVTHEHADHISGFAHAGSLFFPGAGEPVITIGTLWMAWTEDPHDTQARDLRARHAPAFALLEQLSDPGAAILSAEEAAGLKPALDVFAFNALPEAPDAARVTDGMMRGRGVQHQRRTGSQIMEALKVTARTCDFLEPGDLRRIGEPSPQAPPLRVHVLGPPRDKDLIEKSDPSSRRPETYLVEPSDIDTLCAAINLTTRNGSITKAKAPPALFPGRYVALENAHAEIEPDTSEPKDPDAKVANWRIEDPAVKALWEAYINSGDRMIAVDGPGAAQRLALKLDSDTNNTSLVLAFELADGQVLLFAADAQVGNWLSWDRQRYPEKAEDGEPGVDIHDLLSRVRLYKVGHHGSHNATIKMPGLESMTHPQLEVMIPVVEAVAARQGTSGWKMPDPDLNERLKQKAPGRIRRGDDAVEPGQNKLWVVWELEVD